MQTGRCSTAGDENRILVPGSTRLEVLHFPFVLLGSGPRPKCSEIAALARLRVPLARIQPVPARRELANHDGLRVRRGDISLSRCSTADSARLIDKSVKFLPWRKVSTSAASLNTLIPGLGRLGHCPCTHRHDSPLQLRLRLASEARPRRLEPARQRTHDAGCRTRISPPAGPPPGRPAPRQLLTDLGSTGAPCRSAGNK